MQTQETAAVKPLYFIQQILYLFIAHRNYFFFFFFFFSLFFLRNNLSVQLEWEKGKSRGLWQTGVSLSCSVNRKWFDGRWRDVFLHLKSYRRCYIYIMPSSRLPWRCPFNKGESVADRIFFRGNWIIQVDGRRASSLLEPSFEHVIIGYTIL